MNNIKDIHLDDAEFIISKFGGIRPMAQKLDVPVSTVQGWKQRQSIPQSRAVDILSAANKYNLDLGPRKTIAIDKEENILQDKAPVVSSQTYNDKKQLSRWGLFISVSALIVGLGCASWLFWSGVGNKTELILASDISTMNKRLNNLELSLVKNDLRPFRKSMMDEISDIRSEMTLISGQRPGEFISAEVVEKLLNNVKSLENKITNVYEKFSNQAEISKLDLSSLQGKIYELESKLAIVSNNSAPALLRNLIDGPNLMLLVTLLRGNIETGEPYDEIITNLRKLSATDSRILPYLDLLEKYSLDKTPTPSELKKSFVNLKRSIVRSNVIEAEASWDDKLLQRLNGLITIKRSGVELRSDSFHALLVRAETKVNGGDIKGAISELNQLSGEEEKASIVWLKSASHYTNVQLALDQLEEIAIARLQTNNGNL
jgi:hypothetical protein